MKTTGSVMYFHVLKSTVTFEEVGQSDAVVERIVVHTCFSLELLSP